MFSLHKTFKNIQNLGITRLEKAFDYYIITHSGLQNASLHLRRERAIKAELFKWKVQWCRNKFVRFSYVLTVWGQRRFPVFSALAASASGRVEQYAKPPTRNGTRAEGGVTSGPPLPASAEGISPERRTENNLLITHQRMSMQLISQMRFYSFPSRIIIYYY